MSAEKYAAKIEKLLRLAEGTDNQAEAEAFIAKAQELMVTYAIDEAMLAQARGQAAPDKIGRTTVTVTGQFRDQVAFNILYPMILTQNCRAYYNRGELRGEDGRRVKKGAHYVKTVSLHITGFESDLRNIEMLAASLQIQALSAHNAWWKVEDAATKHLSADYRWRARRDFYDGFGSGVNAKLRDARRAGEAAAASLATERGDVSATESVALVVKSRKEQVDEFYDEKHGRFTRRNGNLGSYGQVSGSARSAGHEAGRRADVGQSRVGGSRKALGQ